MFKLLKAGFSILTGKNTFLFDIAKIIAQKFDFIGLKVNFASADFVQFSEIGPFLYLYFPIIPCSELFFLLL
ncbi:hypothetical protein FNO01nite_07240 [Flavobacterium noncentrifugens]|nr:hypothetical protein FNO01nite_07240 [Flavobacterium noncentrifugens]